MTIEIRGNHSLMLQIVREHVEKRLRFALARFGTEIVRTRCEIDDVNGPRSGVDKNCRITVELRSGETLRGEATTDDFFASVDRSVDRIARNVARSIDRRREHRHVSLSDVPLQELGG
jgi:putative sigma-54 modulation protein